MTKMLSFQATDEEAARWKEAAYGARITLSAWIRNHLNGVEVGERPASEPTKPLKEAKEAKQTPPGCPMSPPRGTKCKNCGKKHPL